MPNPGGREKEDMSSYGGRRGPNVTQYLNALQTDAPADESFMEDDLALFTNTQFFDFDAGRTTDYQAPSVKPDVEQRPSRDDVGSSTSPVADIPGSLDFMQEFNFASPDFSYQNSSLAPYSDALPLHSLQSTGSVPYVTSAPQQASFAQAQPPRTGDKRKANSSLAGGDGTLSLEEQSRIAAEEDKRRRNTAASARFRIKKKQREQALEKSAKEMSEKVTVLEGKIQQLETENRWLKSMILEKNGGNEQIAALLERGLHTQKDPAKQQSDANKGTETSQE